MASLSIQFHALPDELIPLVLAFVDETRARVVALKFPPFEAYDVSGAAVLGAMNDERVYGVAIIPGGPKLPATSMTELIDNNPNALLIEIGRRVEHGLEESRVSSRADDPAAMASWRKLAKRIKTMTRTGVLAVNPESGATSRLKDHRFTVGAKASHDQGVPMLPAGGTSRLRFTAP